RRGGPETGTGHGPPTFRKRTPWNEGHPLQRLEHPLPFSGVQRPRWRPGGTLPGWTVLLVGESSVSSGRNYVGRNSGGSSDVKGTRDGHFPNQWATEMDTPGSGDEDLDIRDSF
ncbi:unnamed protein product, partial [Larinioides sclopetarius]